jgi:hypothetical protein
MSILNATPENNTLASIIQGGSKRYPSPGPMPESMKPPNRNITIDELRAQRRASWKKPDPESTRLLNLAQDHENKVRASLYPDKINERGMPIPHKKMPEGLTPEQFYAKQEARNAKLRATNPALARKHEEWMKMKENAKLHPPVFRTWDMRPEDWKRHERAQDNVLKDGRNEGVQPQTPAPEPERRVSSLAERMRREGEGLKWLMDKREADAKAKAAAAAAPAAQTPAAAPTPSSAFEERIKALEERLKNPPRRPRKLSFADKLGMGFSKIGRGVKKFGNRVVGGLANVFKKKWRKK